MRKTFIFVALILISLPSSAIYAQSKAKPSVQNVSITLTAKGYNPSTLKLRKGIRARLTFIRKTDSTCGQQLLIPSYNISRDLPLNQPVTVIFTPRKNGTFRFTCGMQMLRGKLIVS